MNRLHRLHRLNRLHRVAAVVAVLVVAPTASSASVVSAAPAASHRGSDHDGTLSVDDATPTVGHRIFLKGHIRAAAAHSEAVLQVLYDNRRSWKDEGRDRVNMVGHYVFTERVTTERTREYRVVEAGGDGQPRRQSKVVTVVPVA